MLHLSQNSPNSWNNNNHNNNNNCYSIKKKLWPTVWHNSTSYTPITLQVYCVGLLEWLERRKKNWKGWGLFPPAQSVWVFVHVWGCVYEIVCVYVEVCMSLQVWLLNVGGGREGGSKFSWAFTSWCQWPWGLPVRSPLRLLDRGVGVPDCDCVGERWSPPYQLCPCHLAVQGEGAPARGG